MEMCMFNFYKDKVTYYDVEFRDFPNRFPEHINPIKSRCSISIAKTTIK